MRGQRRIEARCCCSLGPGAGGELCCSPAAGAVLRTLWRAVRADGQGWLDFPDSGPRILRNRAFLEIKKWDYPLCPCGSATESPGCCPKDLTAAVLPSAPQIAVLLLAACDGESGSKGLRHDDRMGGFWSTQVWLGELAVVALSSSREPSNERAAMAPRWLNANNETRPHQVAACRAT